MFRTKIILVAFLALAAVNTVFSQAVAIDAAVANAAQEISGSVPQGTKVAVLNISSDYETLSDYIINELIVNLVNKRSFQVVPRSAVELELANKELDFQMTGVVSDESQKRLGQFLGAGTIISGSVTRDSANSYRLTVNAIDLESFTYQSSYRISIANDNQLKALIVGSGGTFYEDYTVGQRFGMAGLNIFGGAGSIINGHKIGWVVTGVQGIGLFSIISGVVCTAIGNDQKRETEEYLERGGGTFWDSYGLLLNLGNGLTIAGSIIIGAGVVFGLVIPFFHHKPNTSVSQNDFPFNLELVSANNQGINGIRLLYNMRF